MTAPGNPNEPNEDANHGSLSPFVCACFTLNYLIGTGFLTLPWAFEVSGIFLSIVTMAFTCLIANIASDYLLTSMARADALVVLQTAQAQEADSEAKTLLQPKDTRATAFAVEFDDATDAQKVSQVHAHARDEGYVKLVQNHGKLLVSERKFELTELCQIFLGKAGLLAYGISASLDIYGFLWAYSAVFGSAMSKLIPLGTGDEDKEYAIWLGIFALIVIPLSMLHLSEQATVQVILSGCRILMIIFMVGTPLVAELDTSLSGDAAVPHFGDQVGAEGAPWMDITGLHKMFPAVVFSLLFHQAVPGLADEMKDKPKIGLIFGYTYILCGLAYSLIGIVGAWYFGSDVYQSANLNWHLYHGGTGTLVVETSAEGDETHYWGNVAFWATAVKTFVVVFPAIDVVSAFPIYAYVLGNTLLGIFHADNVQEIQRDRRVLTFYRCIASIPPIVGALYLRELGTITDYSGLVGLAIAFCFPPLLLVSSEKRLREMGAPYKTRYERLLTSRWAANFMFCFGVVSILVCFLLLTFGG